MLLHNMETVNAELDAKLRKQLQARIDTGGERWLSGFLAELTPSPAPAVTDSAGPRQTTSRSRSPVLLSPGQLSPDGRVSRAGWTLEGCPV